MAVRNIRPGVYAVGSIDWGRRLITHYPKEEDFKSLDRLADEILQKHQKLSKG